MTPTTPDTSPGRVKLLRHQSADTSQEFPSTPHKGGKKGGGDGKETPSAVRKKVSAFECECERGNTRH
eukprot:372241-Amorphochlora_amoeboformis.AAC.1